MAQIKIERIFELTRVDAAGKVSYDVRIYYTTAKGFAGTVEIPKAEATPERIREAVLKDAERFEQVLGKTIGAEKKKE